MLSRALEMRRAHWQGLLADKSSSQMSGKVSLVSWIYTYSDRPNARYYLLCFPHAGAGAVAYFNWAKLFPDAYEVSAVELPGRGRRFRETPVTTLTVIADEIARTLRLLGRRRIILFGHSMGATIAFEVARRLRGCSEVELTHLFVSGARAPQAQRPVSKLHELPMEAFLARIADMDATSADFFSSGELVQLFAGVLKADFKALETYEYRAPCNLNVPITACRGDQDHTVPAQALRQWSEVTSGAFDLCQFPGGHLYVQQQARALADQIVKSTYMTDVRK